MILFKKTRNSSLFLYNNHTIVKKIPLDKKAYTEANCLRALWWSKRVVDLQFTFTCEKEYCLVMPRLHTLCVQPKMSSEKLIPFAREVLECVCDCHNNGIIHGDIKLDNFCRGNNDMGTSNLKLIDFGNSAFVEDPLQSVQCDQLTWFYAAPEAFRRTLYMTSDVFSVGVILYFLLTDQHPYQNKMGVWETQLKPITTDSTDFSEWLRLLLSLNPHERVSSQKALTLLPEY